MIYTKELIVILTSYLLGCFSTGYYLVRFRTGRDIRDICSKSTGAKNAGRILGKSGFFIVLLGDFFKGVVAITIALVLQPEPWAILVSLLAVVMGHIWPVQLGFRGGKGIAVTFGALLIFDYFLVIGIAAVFLLVFPILRKYVISGLLGIATLPLISILLKQPIVNTIGLAVLVFIILFAHRVNIRQAIQNTNIAANSVFPRKEGVGKNA
jgi:glycerol-3-phosphate acyltransferase PlsY